MSDPLTMPAAGLFTTGETAAPVPLAGVSIEADVHHFSASVVVSHRYVNRETTPIEVVYVFPLDEGAAVCGFEAIVDGTLVVGEVLEREKAFEMYDDAMEQGHGAFLLDEERPDLFQANIGNLPPGKEVLVRLTYVTELAIDGTRLRFAIPTTVSPRYAPAEDHRGTGRSDAEALNPPLAWSVPYGLNLSVRLTMPGRISAVECLSHPIAVTLNEREATVALAQRDVALDRDFVLSIDLAGLDAPRALVERADDGAEAIAVAFAPAFETNSAPAEVVFLVDRSGSMQGTSIEEARNALQMCLRSMTPSCCFNIVGFGSRYEPLFPESRAYDQASLASASEHVAGMQADLGGTEILPALQFVLDQRRRPEIPRQVVILTDGEITNTDAVIALAANHASDARIFSFGIGAGASHHLVRGLARAGGGSAEFIYPGERIEPKVLRQFARLLSPALTDVKVEWTGGTVTQAPAKVPPVFAGGRLLVYGFVKDGRPVNVRLSAKGPAGAIGFDVPLDVVVAGSGRTVATLAARARIRELEEGGDWFNGRGSRQKGRKTTDVTKEIVALSTKYGLISRETSFVAIERRETPAIGDVKLRKVPVALTTGWGGLQDTRAAGMVYCRQDLSAPSVLQRSYKKEGFGRIDERQSSYAASWLLSEAAPALRRPHTPRRGAVAPASMDAGVAPAGMHALIVLQAADGSWDLTSELATILGRELDDLVSAVAGAAGSRDNVRHAWATALALAWLQQHAAGVEDEWRLLATKARRWIANTPAVPPGGWAWLDAARDYVRS